MSAIVLQSFGIFGMLGAKVFVVLACVVLAQIPENPTVSISSPTALVVVGTFLTTWNTVVILALS